MDVARPTTKALAEQLGLRLAAELRPGALPTLHGIPPQRAVYPALDSLVPLLPEGGLAGQIGIDASRIGATNLMFHLLAAATASGRWCALVGFPDLYPLAARAAGVDLGRLVLVHADAGDRLDALGALCEGVPIIVASPKGLTPRQLQRAASRANRSGAVLLWWERQQVPRLDARLTVTSCTWLGLRRNEGRRWGAGRLTGCHMRVTSTWRGGRRTTAEVWPYGRGSLSDEVVEFSGRSMTH